MLPAAAPLGGLPAELGTKVVARIRAGYPPQSAAHPRQATWRRIVLPGAALCALDAAGAVVAFVTGHPVLGVIALVLFAVLALITLNGVRFVHGDPLRLTTAERGAVSLACGWQSTHGADPDVAAGALAAGRVVASPAWWSPLLDDHRTRLDLRRWLDDLELTARDDPAQARARAAALGDYADGLEAMVRRHGAGEEVATVPAQLDRLLAAATGGSDRLFP